MGIPRRTLRFLAALALGAALTACSAPKRPEAVGTAAPDVTAVRLRSLLDTATAELGLTRTDTSFTVAWCDTFGTRARDRYVVVGEYRFELREGDGSDAAAMRLRDRWNALGWNPVLSYAPTDVAVPSAGLARLVGTDPAGGLRVKAKTLPTALAVTTISDCFLFPEGRSVYDYQGPLLGDQGVR